MKSHNKIERTDRKQTEIKRWPNRTMYRNEHTFAQHFQLNEFFVLCAMVTNWYWILYSTVVNPMKFRLIGVLLFLCASVGISCFRECVLYLSFSLSLSLVQSIRLCRVWFCFRIEIDRSTVTWTLKCLWPVHRVFIWIPFSGIWMCIIYTQYAVECYGGSGFFFFWFCLYWIKMRSRILKLTSHKTRPKSQRSHT